MGLTNRIRHGNSIASVSQVDANRVGVHRLSKSNLFSESAEKPSIELWEEVARECEYATFFHTPAWARIIEKSLPKYRISTKVYVFEDGISAILPLMTSGRVYKKTSYSMAPGVYGGPIAGGELNPERIRGIFSDLCRLNVRNMHIVGNPLFDYEMPAGYRCRDDFTHILKLDKGFDSIWKGFSKGHRSSAKKAERMGVQIDLARSSEDYGQYYRVYEDSLRRWGDRATSHYEFGLFQNIFEEDNSDIRLWLARVGEEVIAGALVFYWNNHIVWWHGAALDKFFEYCAPNLLNTEIIRDGCQRGYLYYDFNPSGGHKGVADFKRRFGAEKRKIRIWSSHSVGDGIRRRLREALRRS